MGNITLSIQEKKLFMKFVIIGLLVIAMITTLSSKNPSNKYYDRSKSHHTPNGFTNPYISNDAQNKTFSDLYKMMRESRPKSPDNVKNIIITKTAIENHINKGQNFYLWIGHSTAFIHIKGISILTDPIFSDRCSPVQFAGPKRYSKPAISIDSLPKVDLIVISHNHYDHLDYKSVKTIGDSAFWFVPLGLKKWFIDQGVKQVIEMDWFDSYDYAGINIDCLPSQHWSKRSILKSFDT